MALLVLILTALFTLASAQYPGVPHGGGNCTGDWDCSLGGECQDSVCVCDAWFTGLDCHYLNLQPAQPDAGLLAPTYHSWGGHPLRDDEGTYHLFASFMCDHATLASWTTKSSVAHATSASPVGPYILPPGNDSQLVVPPWSHGAYIVQDPPSQQFLLWHLGDGSIAPSGWAPCYDSNQTTPEAAAAALAAKPPQAAVAPGSYRSAPPSPGQRQAFVQTAPSLLGPWSAWNNDTGVSVSFPPGSWCSAVDNPAPYIFDNGTTLLFFRSETCPPGWGALAPACIGVARADTWEGPYESLFVDPITHPEGEDPAVWRDPRGNFHMFTNVNTYHARCAAGVPCGGHAWSLDGLTWSNQSIGAFGPVVRWANGSYYTGSYAERPQILQDAAGTPVAFYFGFAKSSYDDSANFAQLFCTDPTSGLCGPTIPPPPPPPKPVHYTQAGAPGLCLLVNNSAAGGGAAYPCPGGHADACPIALGDCSAPGAVWSAPASWPAPLSSLAFAGTVTNVDCDSCALGTVVKQTNNLGYASPLALDAAAGTLAVPACPGMCVSALATAGPRVPPCEGGEPWLPASQLALVSCGDAAAGGWAQVPVTAAA